MIKKLNVINCGMCGTVFTHAEDHVGFLHCVSCGFHSDQCDFPDFFAPELDSSYVSLEALNTKLETAQEKEHDRITA
jgi:transcription elongation factor Elf1